MAKRYLDMLLWHPEKNINNCLITYKHRGIKGNLKTIPGSSILSLRGGFIILEDEKQIPCHRIIRIKCDNKILWEKTSKVIQHE
jgi:uncharacterized protein (UPF0248 family)